MPELLTFVVLSLATYRIGRFILLDSLIDGLRDWFFDRLNRPEKLTPFRLWLMNLLTCVYCITIWIAAAVVAFWSLVIRDEWIGWSFLIVWPAVGAASLLPWEYLDSE